MVIDMNYWSKVFKNIIIVLNYKIKRKEAKYEKYKDDNRI